MPKWVHQDEVDLEEEILEQENSPKLVLNDSPWEMEQHLDYLPQSPLTLKLEERINFYRSLPSKDLQVEKLVTDKNLREESLCGDLDEVKEAIAAIIAEEPLKAVKADEQWLTDWRRRFPKILSEGDKGTKKSKPKKRGPTSMADARKIKSMDAGCYNASIQQGNSATPPILRSVNVVRNLDNSFKNTGIAPKVKITQEDIEDEIHFWSSSIVAKESKQDAIVKEKLPDADGFQEVRKGSKGKSIPVAEGTKVDNSFVVYQIALLLEDIKFRGSFFTWSNKRQGNERIWSKIDRVLANKKWMDQYPNAEAVFTVEGLFDHTPVIVSIYPEILRGKMPFKYFRMWSSHPRLLEIVTRVCKSYVTGTKMFQVTYKLRMLKAELNNLNRREFSNIQEATTQAKEDLVEIQKKLQADSLQHDLIEQEMIARKRYGFLLKGLSSFLQQKSKVNWIKDGDENSTIFHASIRERRKQNSILSIEDQQGIREEDQNKITEAFVSFYHQLLGSKMENRKQDNWDIVADEVTEAELSFLHSGKMLRGATVLTLVPKSKGPNTGDPMSPLLFVLRMEYLSRIMIRIGTKPEFHYHDRCKELKMNHLMFADDVILFFHGDFKSIHYLLQGLKLFSCTSGLQPNSDKSAIYCCGMEESEVQMVIDRSGFSKKEVPFKYLGIPICAKRISGKECMVLAEKMTARIRSWSSRNLSLAGRAVLVNSVLMSIHSYWSQIMILPKKIIKDIEMICRAYLWKGHHTAIGPGLIAWENIKGWLNWKVETIDLDAILRWIERSNAGRFRKSFWFAVTASTVY
uniref:Reverse transcriptase domain-containing protein n=1 Tax=Cannabis sativa TaxID=3483 RepID=A0A803P955_CANSA